MQQKFFIPTMSNEEILKWSQNIKPIVCYNGDRRYLRELSIEELTKHSYLWLKSPEDFSETVDFSKIGILADVKMLHSYSYHGFFKPSVGEIIRQIPEELRNVTVAFEIIYSPYGQPDFDIFKDEFNQHYHVSIVRLYQNYGIGVSEATKILEYPTKTSCLPMLMEVEKFKKLIN